MGFGKVLEKQRRVVVQSVRMCSLLKNEYNPRTLEGIWRIAEWFSSSALAWLAAIGVAKSVQKRRKMVAEIDKK